MIDNGGHFEKGRWVTMFRENSEPYKEPTFDLTGKRDVPIFRQGACIGYRTQYLIFGTYTKSQLEKIFADRFNELNANGTVIMPASVL
jgi:hypothetical protein